jgi:hypothetical protein
MHQKRVTFGRVQEFWWGASRTHRKGTFVADSPDSGLVYPHKVGLPSHRCNGNWLIVNFGDDILTERLGFKALSRVISPK